MNQIGIEGDKPNIRELHIDLDRSFGEPVIYGSQACVRPASVTWAFDAVLWINGWRVARQRFSAMFTEEDFNDEKRMAENIIEQLKHRSRPEIWDARYRIVGDRWEDHIKFSPAAKEAIEFLSRYTHRLIEVFTNQLNDPHRV